MRSQQNETKGGKGKEAHGQKNEDDLVDEQELRELEEERKAALSSFNERPPNAKRNIHPCKQRGDNSLYIFI